MARLRGGQAVARALHAEGIDTVFGIVGTHNSLIFDGLTDLPEMRVVTTRHEGGAGFMADGYARATGRPAASIVVPGPGLTNLMTARLNYSATRCRTRTSSRSDTTLTCSPLKASILLYDQKANASTRP